MLKLTKIPWLVMIRKLLELHVFLESLENQIIVLQKFGAKSRLAEKIKFFAIIYDILVSFFLESFYFYWKKEMSLLICIFSIRNNQPVHANCYFHFIYHANEDKELANIDSNHISMVCIRWFFGKFNILNFNLYKKNLSQN